MDLTLNVGAVTSETVVSADAALVETRNTALSAVIDTNAIRLLPLNGRDFAQLALLTPGVAPSRRTSDSGGAGAKLVIGGNRPSQISFLLDGSDINDANNNTPGSAAGVLLGVDTLAEFRVLTNSYSSVRPQQRWRGHRRHAGWDEPASRFGVRIRAQQRVRRQELLRCADPAHSSV